MNSEDPHRAEVDDGSRNLRGDTTASHLSDATAGFEPQPSRADGLTGRSLGDYLLLEQIGAGGGGHVYRAQHRRMDRIVALKVFSRGVLGDDAQVKRFYREVRAAARLFHPNIVMAFDAGEFQSIHFLVMELIDGQSLASLVKSEGPLKFRQAMQYIVQAAQGLAYAHSKGIVHRDVKPHNIMVDRSGTVKLLDMGLARSQKLALQEVQDGEATAVTSMGIVLGTASYMSPEQITDSSSVDERSDIYSLGCTLYHLLTGRSPFEGTILEVFRAHAEAPIPCLKNARNDVPYGVDTTYQRMLSKDPQQRQATVQEVIAALQPYCAEPNADSSVSVTSEPARGRGHSHEAAGECGRALGFDLSSKHFYVSSINEQGEAVPVKDRDGALATPAVLVYRRGRFEIGGAALKAADSSDEALIERITCRLGIDKPAYRIADQPIRDEALTALLIAGRLGVSNPTEDRELCYTIPGCHGETRRRAYRDAHFIAQGRDCLAVNASTAVATQFSFLHGWLNPHQRVGVKNLLVFRCGGYSFDATVYQMEDRRLTALAVAGSSDVGEYLWENRVLERLLDRMEPGAKKIVMADKTQMNKLRRQVDAAKAALAKGTKRVTLRVRVADQGIEETVSYQSLNTLGDDIMRRLKALTERAVTESGTTWEKLDHVLLSGGAVAMPFVQEAVKQWIGNREICSLAGPEIASGGAALVAENSRGTRNSTLDFQVRDVASYSYGIRSTKVSDNTAVLDVVIPRGSKLPATMRGTVAKHTARQSEIEFEVVEFDEFNPDAVTVLGICRITTLPPGLSVGAPVEVEFELDSRGILSVFAISLSTGRRFVPEYQPKFGLTAGQRTQWRTWLQASIGSKDS